MVREADAVLLGFPLLRQMHEEVRSKDLHYYESVSSIVFGAVLESDKI